MEQTELRKEFFAEVRSDPYANAILHHVAHAWADGYEQALRDHNLESEIGHHDRFNQAVDWLTEARNKAHAQALIAFAQIGKLLGEPRLPGA